MIQYAMIVMQMLTGLIISAISIAPMDILMMFRIVHYVTPVVLYVKELLQTAQLALLHPQIKHFMIV